MTRRLSLLTIIVLLLAATAQASDVSGRLGLGLEAGLMKLIRGDWDYSNVDQNIGFHLQRGLSPHWSLELALKYGWVRPGVDSPDGEAGLTTDTGSGLYTVMWHPRVGLLYHVAPESRISPFVGFSFGGLAWSVRDLRGQEDPGFDPDGPTLSGFDTGGDYQELRQTNLTASLAAGVDCFLFDSLALNLGARCHFLPGNTLDNIGLSHYWGPEYVDANTALVEGFAGLTFFFGSSDRDRDGISNQDDACPGEPEDFDGHQDDDGCPDPDNDNDGLGDDVDGCPDLPEDLDGFQDSNGCPDPDNDGDGSADTEDGCPDAAEDRDGFEDADGCPDPDNDGDGVPDVVDRCPDDTPAGVAVDEHGCPVVEEIPTEQPLRLEGVNFVTGSAVLTPESVTSLEEVAASLLAYPEVTIEVRGHTDSVGSEEANRALSQNRALSVRDFLIRQGIDPARIVAVGYGENFPIGSNDTPEGRAQNRRVEIQRTD
jgi:outer membrane protein OmpA-like peptidoglycan-associated protein